MARVLIVDDDPAWRNLYRMAFESRFEIFEATDGYQALSVLEAVHPDAILLDLRMPKMDGLDFIRRVDRRGPRPPIIVCSGIFGDGERPGIPGVQFAAKSPDLKEVWTAIRTVIPEGTASLPAGKPAAAIDEMVWRD